MSGIFCLFGPECSLALGKLSSGFIIPGQGKIPFRRLNILEIRCKANIKSLFKVDFAEKFLMLHNVMFRRKYNLQLPFTEFYCFPDLFVDLPAIPDTAQGTASRIHSFAFFIRLLPVHFSFPPDYISLIASPLHSAKASLCATTHTAPSLLNGPSQSAHLTRSSGTACKICFLIFSASSRV